MKNPRFKGDWTLGDNFANAADRNEALKIRSILRQPVSDLIGFRNCLDSKLFDSHEKVICKAGHAAIRKHPDYDLEVLANYCVRDVSRLEKSDRDRTLHEVIDFRNLVACNNYLGLTLCETLEQPTDRMPVTHCLCSTVPTAAVAWYPNCGWPPQRNGTLPILQGLILDEAIRSVFFSQIRAVDWSNEEIVSELLNRESELGNHLQSLKLKVTSVIGEMPLLADFLDPLTDQNFGTNLAQALPFAWPWFLASEATPSERMDEAGLPQLGIFDEWYLFGTDPDRYFWS